MRPNKVETAVQCFYMSCARFSGHGNSIHNIIPQLKKVDQNKPIYMFFLIFFTSSKYLILFFETVKFLTHYHSSWIVLGILMQIEIKIIQW